MRIQVITTGTNREDGFKTITEFIGKSIMASQLGFHKSDSTLQQLHLFLQDTYVALGTNSQIDVVYLDFSKIVECIPQLGIVS